MAFFLRCFIFPRGRTYSAPSDELSRSVVDLITHSGEARERLSQQAYTTLEPGNPLGLLQEALELTEKHEALETKLRQARKEGLIHSDYFGYQIDEAERGQVISKSEAAELRIYHEKVLALLSVDDFDAAELGRSRSEDGLATASAQAPTAKRAAARKSSKRKSATVAPEKAGSKNNS